MKIIKSETRRWRIRSYHKRGGKGGGGLEGGGGGGGAVCLRPPLHSRFGH